MIIHRLRKISSNYKSLADLHVDVSISTINLPIQEPLINKHGIFSLVRRNMLMWCPFEALEISALKVESLGICLRSGYLLKTTVSNF